MRHIMSRWGKWTCVGLIACSMSATGCKSGWKMPGKDMFSWNKKPSESTIAGKGPSMTFPTSPASNHNPTAIASSNTGSPSSPVTKPNTNFSTAGYAGGTPTTPTSASGANGYQVGPYGMAGSTTPTAPSGIPNAQLPALGNNAAIGGAGSAYGAPNSLASRPMPPSSAPGLPAVQTYGGAQNNPYGFRGTTATSNGLAASAGNPSATSGNLTPNTFAQNSSAPAALAPLQPPANPNFANAGFPPATTNYSNALMGNPTNPNAAVAGAPAALNAPNNVANNPYSPGTTYPSGAMSSPFANNASNVTNAAGYRPGSTGRATGFDLAQPAGANMANTNALPAPGSQPTNFAPAYPQNPPMMATPPSGSGYQVPQIVR